MQIDSKSPCGICEKSNRCKTNNKDKVRECGAYKPSEFFKMFEVITRGNCMICGKELTEGLLFCKECEDKSNSRK